MSVAEMTAAGLRAIVDSTDVEIDNTEAQVICALWFALEAGMPELTITESQQRWIISAIRTAYMAGKERRTMFAGYG